MTARKDIKRIIIPPKFAAQFEASKAQTEQDIMTPLTDAQHAVRLICWALAQREIVINEITVQVPNDGVRIQPLKDMKGMPQ